jgi:hypothetical protein
MGRKRSDVGEIGTSGFVYCARVGRRVGFVVVEVATVTRCWTLVDIPTLCLREGL